MSADLFVCRATGKVYESMIELAYSWVGSAAMKVIRSVDTNVWFTLSAAEFDQQFDNYTGTP